MRILGITMSESASGSTALLIQGGNTSNITLAGSLTASDDIDPEDDLDTDNDGTADGPFANGTDRAGIRLVGATPLTGNIILQDTASVSVDGNESYGILLGAGLNGKLVSQANITVIGNNSYGIRTTGDVTGTVQVTGNITVRGENSSAVSVAGDVGGRLTLSGAITSTGYRYTQSPGVRPEGYVETTENDASVIFLDELDASDLLQGGPTVQIAGNIGGGIVLDVAPAYADGIEGDTDGDSIKNGDEDDDGDGIKNRDDTDRDGDGLLDTSEGNSTINSYGSAAALAVGSATQSITVANAGTGAEAYGLINRGAITGQGIYKEVDANAVVIGGNAGQTANIGGGLRNDGTIAALAIDGNATAVRFGQGAIGTELLNTGGITAAASSDVEVDVTAIRIDAGASLTTLTNSGTILASAGGGVADLVAIQDLSGTLTTINNTRSIQAGLSPNADGDAITGTTTAIDVSANTTGVTVLQTGVAGTATATDPDTDGDGVLDSREPTIVGDIRLGSGADTLDIRNGLVQGAIAFGAGADTLSITGGAEVRGALSDSDGNLAINVANGLLETRQNTALNATSLDVGAAGRLVITVDPVADSSGVINVSGAANLATGAQLGVRFNSLLDAPARFDLITAGTLNAGTLNTDFQASSPYLYVVNGGIDAAN
ncbi:MAG: autotransporter outer membrane beta-barrel domain-containing protein, partial [Brevundimonas sp.]